MLKQYITSMKNKTLIILPIVWIVFWLIAFLISAVSMFPGDKMGIAGYNLYISLSCACFSFSLMLFPFYIFYALIFYAGRSKKKLSKRKKKERKRTMIRILQHFALYVIDYYLILFVIALFIAIIKYKKNLLYFILGVALLAGIYFGMKRFYRYCREHPIKRPDSILYIAIFFTFMVFGPFIGGIINTCNVLLDRSYINNPKEATLTKYKMLYGSSRRAKFYYNLEGTDANGKEYAFRIDREEGHPYVHDTTHPIKVYYLPHTGVAMSIE